MMATDLIGEAVMDTPSTCPKYHPAEMTKYTNKKRNKQSMPKMWSKMPLLACRFWQNMAIRHSERRLRARPMIINLRVAVTDFMCSDTLQ